MPTEIDITTLRRMLDEGAQLVEVLPASEYEEQHLPGAINMPLRQIETGARRRLDDSRPVVVYCWDSG